MKNSLKKIIIAIAILSVPFATFAAKGKKPEYDLPTYTVEDISALPQPFKNPIPLVKSQFVGINLQVKLTVNADGRPDGVRLAKPLSSYSDIHQMTFASQIESAVKTWKFEPALDTAGNPITVKVIMPIQVIKKGTTPSAIASLVLDTSKEDRS